MFLHPAATYMSMMNTFSGKCFDPMQMQPFDVSIDDISHALSLLCRGAGHIKAFYSVAQHSLNCAQEARERGYSKRTQLICLLHDASEAYISDVIRPVKAHLTNYLTIEQSIMAVIFKKFGIGPLTEKETVIWKEIDDAVMCYELKYLMPGCEDQPQLSLTSVPDLYEKAPIDVEHNFKMFFYECYQ